jgi:hypothetical protein
LIKLHPYKPHPSPTLCVLTTANIVNATTNFIM